MLLSLNPKGQCLMKHHFTCSYSKDGGLDWCFTLKSFPHETAGIPFLNLPCHLRGRQPVINQLVDMSEKMQPS